MDFKDVTGVVKKGTFPIESIENPYGDYYIVKIKNDAGLTWVPGEHGIYTLPDKQIKGRKYRLFSVASIPEEGFIMIGTRTGKEISSFKQAMLSMEPGEKVTLRGPFGWFKIKDETSPVVLFASGVGVTPVRALLKQLEFNTNRAIEVVYSSSGYYLFGDEIEQIAMNNPMVHLNKLSSREETAAKLGELADKYGNSAYYYNSGAPAVLKSAKKQYMEKGIKKKRIISDTFLGLK
ncbi:FAD-dependent oxidoreductase [Desemzia sp. RIT804]|uniref:FAD-dependent oxidoreductase n=1 Tax=Desemzia sp. RIT 804 TaxID=2810209 RepID=UPI00194E3A8E|nr:FAD-dependent oxidoreductase [Desemzia sp. RIT 804]MBM6614985.1 FAD-dependent oxidoreductase [Desemzia sp. RIT 804]